MRFVKVATFVVLAALLGVVGWAAYRAGWRIRSARSQSEQPVLEYREVQSGPAGEAGTLLTIDPAGQSVLQTIPIGSGGKTMRTQLSCEELAELPRRMKEEFVSLRGSYGQEGTADKSEISIMYKWNELE